LASKGIDTEGAEAHDSAFASVYPLSEGEPGPKVFEAGEVEGELADESTHLDFASLAVRVTRPLAPLEVGIRHGEVMGALGKSGEVDGKMAFAVKVFEEGDAADDAAKEIAGCKGSGRDIALLVAEAEGSEEVNPDNGRGRRFDWRSGQRRGELGGSPVKDIAPASGSRVLLFENLFELERREAVGWSGFRGANRADDVSEIRVGATCEGEA
jgi:hypothetical protein